MRGNAGSRYRLVEDGHLINLPGKEVPRSVEDSTATDVDVKS